MCGIKFKEGKWEANGLRSNKLFFGILYAFQTRLTMVSGMD